MINQKDHNKIAWDVIDKMFKNDYNHLVSHHLTSYNLFFGEKIKKIMKDNNPLNIFKKYNSEIGDYELKCSMFFGGKDLSKIYYGKPIMYDDDNEHLMFPNEARLKNKTYGFNIYYDIEVDFLIINEDKTTSEFSTILKNIDLGKFPIMLQSNLCVLSKLTPQARYYSGECINDKGGYFIIDGKEKVVVCQEQFANNMLYVKSDYNEIYSHSAEIRSVSEDASKPVRTTSVRIVRPTSKYSNNNIVVLIPNVKNPIPLFIVFRALGIISDKEIIDHCLLNSEKYSDYISLFSPCVHDAGPIFTQDLALKYIAKFTKHKTIPSTLNILANYFIPHMGELHFRQKAFFLGHMVFKLLKVYKNVETSTDRDSFKYKRVETTGSLLYDLFREFYQNMLKELHTRFDKEYYYKERGSIYENEKFQDLIDNNYINFFQEKGFIVQNGFSKAFKGQWGSKVYTSKEGIVQDLNRLSFNSAISHCRKLNLPLDSTAKVVAPRLLHGSQFGFIDPVDTPDGGHIGLHKHLAISTKISDSTPLKEMVDFIKTLDIIPLTNVNIKDADFYSKIFANGSWIGVTKNPKKIIETFNIYKRNGIIPYLSTITFNNKDNIIDVLCDSGRLLRPLFHVTTKNIPSYINDDDLHKQSWVEMVSGNRNKAINNKTIYKMKDLFGENISLENLYKSQGIIDFIDSSVANNAFINIYDFEFTKPYTHMEIHPSLMLGVMGNQVIYPNHNPVSRDLFSCGQSKQAVSLYSSNYQYRTDKMSVILNYGQIPLVKSRYLKYINNEEHPYGENVIVAIMSYNGYNVEDSILFNGASIDRGLFRTTYFSTYEDKEEILMDNNNIKTKTVFANIEQQTNIKNILPGFEYHHLDESGLVKENTVVTDKVAIIGKITTVDDGIINKSKKVKKGQLGIVDKVYVSDNEEGRRNCKVRIREERIPNIGDKFCSRCGQKGTVGLIIPEEDMPFTKDGLKPDIIINPHALPTRMTIGQLIETISGKASSILGSYADCTVFDDTGLEKYRKTLVNNGFNSYCNEVLYDGQTGEQIESDIFIGPTYYMRLKHMVKDKINHRAGGPRDSLTRQTVQGRANDGGLRIGEMERDALVSHGIMSFLKNSMVDRGDKFYLAICNNSGTIAIYNKEKNTLFSPYVDGPIVFDETEGVEYDYYKVKTKSYITNFGKEFSLIQVPYSLKLLMQELATMNVQMRIITADNVETLTKNNRQNFVVKADKILAGNAANEKMDDFEEMADFEKMDDFEKIDDFEKMDDTIVKHVAFSVDETVKYLKSYDDSSPPRPWIIRSIDNSLPDKNITIFTLVDQNNPQTLPPNTIIEKRVHNKLTNTYETPAVLIVSKEDIEHFDNKYKNENPKPKSLETNNKNRLGDIYIENYEQQDLQQDIQQDLQQDEQKNEEQEYSFNKTPDQTNPVVKIVKLE